MIYVILTIISIVIIAVIALVPLFLLLYAGEFALNVLPFGRVARFLLVAFKSLRRNLVRTSLTYLASFVLVVVVVMIWSVLYFLGELTSEKAKDVKIIVSDKYQAVSQMPFYYAGPLSEGAARPNHPEDVRPQDSMTWQIYVGTLDPLKKAREDQVFFIALEPSKMLTILENVFDDFNPGEAHTNRVSLQERKEQLLPIVKKMESNKRAVVVGRNRLEAIKKNVNDRFSLTGLNYQGIDLEFEIVGVIPWSRYNEIALMNRDYLNTAIDAYPRTHGVKHPLADKSLYMVWLQVPDLKAFSKVAEQIDACPTFVSPPVKCETLSSGVNTWIEGFQDLFWGLRWLLAPAILAIMTLVMANAISISVRERRTEMAVLKVLGYRPGQLLFLVLGEAMLIGAISGGLSAGLTYLVVNKLPHSQSFQIWVPEDALWWGPLVGGLTALAGSFFPAWSACKVRVSEVFARVT
jgi:putative ABC transport system permease protein